MMPEAARGAGTFAGTRWFLGGVSMALIAVLSLWLLSALQRMQVVVERMVVEQTVQNIRTGLKVAMAEAVISGREAEIAGWAGENPVRWLVAPPSDYRGECHPGIEAAEGEWCFERASGDLVYRPRHADGVRGADGRAPTALRWRVSLVHGANQNDGAGWLRVENVTSYLWVIE